MSLSRAKSMLAAGACLALAGAAPAQYSTKVQKPADKPTLRATAVLEWTGDLEKPSASRLIPIAVWDGEQYQPGGLYLAKPAPLALLSGTQYELEKSGEPAGFFNVRGAATLAGSWVGVGRYQPVPPPPPPPKLKPSKRLPAPTPTTASKADDSGERPTLHRKTGESAPSTSTGAPGAGSSSPAGTDADKPTLHRRTSDDAGSASSSDTKDPDRPTLHRRADETTGAGGSAPEVDPDRPTLHKAPTAAEAGGADVGSAPGVVTAVASADPDRPTLRRGKFDALDTVQVPSKIEGTSALHIEQMVAVSDPKPGEGRTYVYRWPSPEEEAKMRSAMEALAAQALNGTTPVAQAATFGPAAKAQAAARAKAAKTAGSATAAPALADEKFASYELAFSSGPTVVLSACGGPGGDRYVTLIAQPDFYGQPRVLFRQVTTAAILDQTPRMQLVDAVDTNNDQQAELIFELIGAPLTSGAAPERQYAIYNVTAAGAQQVFATGNVP